jgi:hypothetical protein
MPTLDYLAQPSSIPSDVKLLMTDLLLILEDDSSQKVPNRLLNRKQEVFNQAIRYINLWHSGFKASHLGRYSVAYPESVKAYGGLSDCLGFEASCADFPVQLENYCKTLRSLTCDQQPSPQETRDLKSFFKRIYSASKKKESAQPRTETILQALSYVSR